MSHAVHATGWQRAFPPFPLLWQRVRVGRNGHYQSVWAQSLQLWQLHVKGGRYLYMCVCACVRGNSVWRASPPCILPLLYHPTVSPAASQQELEQMRLGIKIGKWPEVCVCVCVYMCVFMELCCSFAARQLLPAAPGCGLSLHIAADEPHKCQERWSRR